MVTIKINAMISEERIVIVERLLESKAITFREALKLMETEKEYVYNYWPTIPLTPLPTWPQPWDTVTFTTLGAEVFTTADTLNCETTKN